MPTRIETILAQARVALSDPNSDRWTDSQLLTILSEGQIYAAKESKSLRNRVLIPLVEQQAEYLLPFDTYEILRVLYKNKAIPLVSHYEMDSRASEWEIEVAEEVQNIVYDKVNSQVIKVYPIPVANSTFTSDIHGILTGAYDIQFEGDLYGAVFGFNDSIPLPELNDNLTVYYTQLPAELATVTDELALSPAFDVALKHFVVGMALRNNLDTQNRAVGQEELAIFNSEINKLTISSSYDSARSVSKMDTHYIGAFD